MNVEIEDQVHVIPEFDPDLFHLHTHSPSCPCCPQRVDSDEESDDKTKYLHQYVQ